MLENEWLAIGYDKGIIDEVPIEKWIYFKDVYSKWYLSKINSVKAQSADRIEVTYNKYYSLSKIMDMPIHKINEEYIYKFLNDIIIRYGNITKKEYGRIYQIINNVMTFATDVSLIGAYRVNWDIVKKYIAYDKLDAVKKEEYSISEADRQLILDAVLNKHIYDKKRSASLCICLNFFLGLRIGELASIKWQDIDFKRSVIHIHSTLTKSFERDEAGQRVGACRYYSQDTTKTPYSVREVPLVQEAVYILYLLKEHHVSRGYDSEYIAYDGTDSILAKSIERCITRLCKLCDVPVFNSHLIRKTFATELHKNGVPTKIISDLMGHSEMRTTERFYIISSGDDIKYLRDMMQDALAVTI